MTLRCAGETILVVDDEDPIRALARAILEARGYQVLDAESAEAALRLAQNHSGTIHLLLTDMELPRVSGRELHARIAADRTDMKVLYMSGHTEDVIEARGSPPSSFVQKPFSIAELAAKVREVLDLPSSGQESSAV